MRQLRKGLPPFSKRPIAAQFGGTASASFRFRTSAKTAPLHAGLSVRRAWRCRHKRRIPRFRTGPGAHSLRRSAPPPFGHCLEAPDAPASEAHKMQGPGEHLLRGLAIIGPTKRCFAGKGEAKPVTQFSACGKRIRAVLLRRSAAAQALFYQNKPALGGLIL